MTEAEWLTCEDIGQMIEHLLALGKRNNRRLRLFALGACEYSAKLTLKRDYSRLWYEAACLIDHKPQQRQPSDVGEGAIDPWEDRIARQLRPILPPRELPTSVDWWRQSLELLSEECIRLHHPIEIQRRQNELHFLAIFRDVFGNPFRPISIDFHWLTSSVVDLAKAIYEDGTFDSMPILADALMDAGCDNDDIIQHCRGDGPHVRGCWVVDLILGKE